MQQSHSEKAPDLIPSNDAARLDALHRYRILYTGQEEVFDNITRIMASVFGMPMAFVSLVDEYTVFYKSKAGPFKLPEVDRKDSLCSITILNEKPTVFYNTLKVPYLTTSKYVQGDGGLRFYAGAPLVTPDGYRIGTVCVCDVAPRNFSEVEKELLERFARLVQHEIEIRLAAKTRGDELEQMVQARTAELQRANTQLQQTNAELEQFAYVSSHDLQEPLRKITVFTSLIVEQESGSWSERSRGYFQKILDSANRMSVSLKDLLHYANLSKKECFEMVDLNEVVESVQLDLELLIRQKKAVIEYGRLPVIPAIRLQMHQLFYNLLNNALKYQTPGLAPVISISARQPGHLNQTGPEAFELCITDNGIGFDMRYHDKIFTMFQRLHNRQEYTGNGIGLALCRKVVQNHGGSIYAQSSPGAGTSFYVLLPTISERLSHMAETVAF